MAKYNRQTAASLAKRIYNNLGARIAQATRGTNLRQEQFAGFVAVENAQMNSKATRFEAHHFAALLSLRDNGYWTRKGRRLTLFNGIRQAQIKDATDDALRALAKSYGLTQIMGWHTVNNLRDIDGSPMTVSDLTDRAEELHYTVQLMENVSGTYLRRGDFANVLHIWNTGGAIQNGVIKTHDPNYISNARLVAEEYLKLIRAVPFDEAANDDDEQAAAEQDVDFIAQPSVRDDAQGGDAETSRVPQTPQGAGGSPVPPASAPANIQPPAETIGINAVTPQKERSLKALLTLIGGSLTAIGIPFTFVGDSLRRLLDSGNPAGTLIVVAIILGIVAIVCVYLMRQTTLDQTDRNNATTLNSEQMKYAADRNSNTVQLLPNVTPAPQPPTPPAGA